MASAPFSLRLDPNLKDRLDKEAAEADRSASWIAARAIEAYLDGRDAKRRAIAEALAEADRDEFVSGESVAAWMDSWGSGNETLPPGPDIGPTRR